ncbi:flavodoxin domain-containing protein [Corynebacterium camporealensis]|uniref:flavodoxin domain-containing protein n=1 Tax=Corynebacterium camporealensis TaxID=161896 RepID=UPI0034CFE84B
MATIVYDSFYGSTRQYADALAVLIDATVVPLAEANGEELIAAGEPVIVLSPVHGPQIRGAEFVAKHRWGKTPVAVAAVGMTLLDEARQKDQLARIVGENIPRFYLPGRLNYSQLSQSHRTVMRTIVTALRLKPLKSANEKAMVKGYDKDIDRVNIDELKSLVKWARS